ncbi:MAG: hypothetical protein PF904_15790 [Kiritimatiellae bacterium]|jgi:hypothetical protein|nr:hypothetical protein [Kiritimatiellia bacterium]
MDLFEQLRGSPHVWQNSTVVPADKPFFVITPGERGASVAIVDKKGRPWSHSYQFFQGAVREALKAVETVQLQSSAGFTWEESGDEILLAENEHLMRLLDRTGRLFNSEMRPITVEEKQGKVVVALERDGDAFQASLYLRKEGERFSDFELLTDAYLLVNGKQIIKVAPMGYGFINLPLFATRVQADELSRYLTLLYSTLDMVDLDYEGYSCVEGRSREVENCIIFEESDKRGETNCRALFFEASSSTPYRVYNHSFLCLLYPMGYDTM